MSKFNEFVGNMINFRFPSSLGIDIQKLVEKRIEEADDKREWYLRATDEDKLNWILDVYLPDLQSVLREFSEKIGEYRKQENGKWR